MRAVAVLIVLLVFVGGQASPVCAKSLFFDDERDRISYDELKLNKVTISNLENYISIEEISEEEFYELNFGMKIAAIALTENDHILIRTKENTYHILPFSLELIGALELTGFLEKGSNVKAAKDVENKADTSQIFAICYIFSLSAGFIIYFLIRRKRHRAMEKAWSPGSPERKRKRRSGGSRTEDYFEHVQGIDELKPDLMRLVDALKNPEKYKRLGARPTKGLILYGPPGTERR